MRKVGINVILQWFSEIFSCFQDLRTNNVLGNTQTHIMVTKALCDIILQ